MTDEQAPQTPQASPTVTVTPTDTLATVATKTVAVVSQPSAVVTAVENEVKATLGTGFSNWLKDIFNTNKWIFYTAIPLFIIVMLVIKFHDIIIDILLGSAKSIQNKTVQQDAALAAQANKTKSEADALVSQAQSLPGQEKPVPDDWYKK